ncbi:MAG: helicase-related protein [Methanomicrobiales archaeon]|nr:helicase-related protein [Methanomicrobiales archaeon]MDI6877628.1 helicase-related protein [Methanomicrobiales archaeon]
MLQIKIGDIVKSAHWPEPVEVKSLQQAGEYLHLILFTTVTKQLIEQMIHISALDSFTIIGKECNCCEDPAKVFLALETLRYRYASMYDPLLAMNISKVEPLPHQIEAVYGYILKLPRIRYLIADDPGAGKTIMAGLIVKELKLRNMAKRILIVGPGHLKDQWKREMKDKFDETFVEVDRNTIASYYGENVWDREGQIITSMDFAKREENLPAIRATRFDLVICDEAHKFAAYKYGEKTEKTERYRLGEVLSDITNHLLFLTATPNRGDPENFRLLLDLLEKGFFSTSEMLMQSIEEKDNPLFIRRIKEDLKDFEGKPLFLPRHVKTKAFNIGKVSPREKDLYNDLSEYVSKQYNKALARDKRRNITFALIILQRRLASSTYALLRSLERRRERLEELLQNAEMRGRIPPSIADPDAMEEMSEDERWREEEEWERISVAENRDELQKEIETIKRLIEQANSIVQLEEEVKLRELRAALSELSARFPERADRKVLVFTESRDTLDHLVEKIREWGYSVNFIHGGMKLEERVDAERIFKNETDVMVATEAAGEGINLQFCHMMINYDLPWNPNRLEQRMGRIHRYGQRKEVYIINLVAEDTREGQVLKRLMEKLMEIRSALGSDKVFDVISEVLYNTNLSQLMVDAAAHARSLEEILKEIDIKVDEEYIARIREQLGETLATRYIDYTRIREMAQRAREFRLIPEYTASYFRKAFEKAGGEIRDQKNGFFSIESIPIEIRRIAENPPFRKSFGLLISKYPKITFDKDLALRASGAEFVSFGHPLFEAVMTWVEECFTGAMRSGATFIDPDGMMDGYILFYEGEVRDGTLGVAGKRLFAFYLDDSNTTAVAPDIIWDLAEAKAPQSECVEIERLKDKVLPLAIRDLERYRGEIQRERERQASIKEKYGLRSLTEAICEIEDDLISLQDRKDRGEPVDLPILNKKRERDEYLKAKEELISQIQKETYLSMVTPRFLGLIRVKRSETIDPAMVRDPEVEAKGMEVAMEYERNEGRVPEDVSEQDLGFDIRSMDAGGRVRYIEVKARAGRGGVALTQNEWFKAQRFGNDYYLYAVMNAVSSPELFIVQNPAETLPVKKRVESVRYLISYDEIEKEGGR